jgi:hypothetical protein
MKVEKFWNQAFVAALSRLPAEKAKEEADAATELCIKQWQSHKFHWATGVAHRWQKQDIGKIPDPTLGLSPPTKKVPQRKASSPSSRSGRT